jgi:catechol 2,3-dioxygenase-like lactoylglutathione lyase family enzyme
MEFRAPVPILRMFDVPKAKDFYVGFLGFAVDWEHTFEPDTPVYMQISRGGCRIHLSEHHGDGTPGTIIKVEMPVDGELEAYQAALRASGYKYYRPSWQDQEWGAREMTVQDPFGNRVVFYRNLPRA